MFNGTFWYNHSQRWNDDSDEEETVDASLRPKPRQQEGSEDESDNIHKQQRLMEALEKDTPEGDQKMGGGEEEEEDDPHSLPVFSARGLLSSADVSSPPTASSLPPSIVLTLCVECGDQTAEVKCIECNDILCAVCFSAIHSKGNRRNHQTERITKAVEGSVETAVRNGSDRKEGGEGEGELKGSGKTSVAPPSHSSHDDDDNVSVGSSVSASSSSSTIPSALPLSSLTSSLREGSSHWFAERARYSPMRLTLEERKVLRLLEAALNVSEYTDKIDIITNKDKVKRIQEQLRDICSVLSGLVVASDYKLGQILIKDKDFSDNEVFFQNVMEIGRRHKIRNPEKMRNDYGKLMFILQDSQQPQINELMGFSLVKPLKTVYSVLENAGALSLLFDKRMVLATGEIKAEKKPRYQIDYEIKQKNIAIKSLSRDYANERIQADEISACIYSLGDAQTFIVQNRNPCEEMIKWLKRYYHPRRVTHPYSLAIVGGQDGARLSHSHSSQFFYCYQSLSLWSSILYEMYKLWILAELDLLDEESPYRLRNTGQGLNRVQSCPRVGKMMHNILWSCQSRMKEMEEERVKKERADSNGDDNDGDDGLEVSSVPWIGSSVIHLGDSNVPSALNFLDKYTQVSRILNPMVITLSHIDKMMEKADTKLYITKTFGSADECRLLILTDFFRHAFDGSGADNFFDAGSCIDGRLTSAWNWCSLIEKKPYYNVFLLTGFQGFDGQF